MKLHIFVSHAAGIALVLFLAACAPQEDASQTLISAPASVARGVDAAPSYEPPSRLAHVSQSPDFGALMRAQGPAVVHVVSAAPPRMDRGGLVLHDQPFHADEALPRSFSNPAARGQGSGFVISSDGLILTNAHVVAGAESITVRTADGKRRLRARVVGSDRQSDIAVLKVDAAHLPVATLGHSASLQPGEWVAAIGSPFGLENTITAGIVSAMGRILPDDSTVPFIQSDVAINPGNSGGPLINTRGEVVGVNSLIYSPTGGYMGLSFSIPIEIALDVAQQLEAYGKVRRGRLGVAIQPLTPELARAFGLNNDEGMVIGKVEPDGPGEGAGLRTGDVILRFGGQAASAEVLPRLIAAAAPGSRQRVELWRDGKRRALTVTLGEHASDERARAVQAVAHETGLSLDLSELPLDQCVQLGIDYGLRVEHAPFPADDVAIHRGDVIFKVGHAPFSDRREFERLVASGAGDYVPLLVRRGDVSMYVPLAVPATVGNAD